MVEQVNARGIVQSFSGNTLVVKVTEGEFKYEPTDQYYNNGSYDIFGEGLTAGGYPERALVTADPVTTGGVVSKIFISDNGSKYNETPAITITGDGTGATAEVEVNGSLTGFTVTSGGSGYTESPLVSIVGGGGSGATAQAIITGGRVTRILVEQPGSGYTSQPSVSVTGGGGTGAAGEVVVNGSLTSFSCYQSR